MLFDRINAGFGLERGYLGIEIRNSLESSVSAVWLEEWPWWIKVFMHTLTITVDGEAVTQGASQIHLHHEAPRGRQLVTSRGC